MEYIQGTSREQITMLPECLDDYVSEESPVRVIDAFIDSLDLKLLGFDRAEPHETGRPMYSPGDLLKLYQYGYLNHIRSSRRLEAETRRNLEVIWLMKRLTPDHKTIARFRHDNADALKKVFREFVKLCDKLGLYGKELIAIDGSKFKAVNSPDRNLSLRNLNGQIDGLDKQLDEYMSQLDSMDKKEFSAEVEKSGEEIQRIISELQKQKAVFQNQADELKSSGQLQKSLTDPDSRRMRISGKWDVGYNVQTAVDAKHKLIVEFEVTNQTYDYNQLSSMSKKATDILETNAFAVAADGGYDSASDIAKCIQNGVTPHVAGANYDICLPVDEPCDNPSEPIISHSDGRCVYLSDRNVFLCPMGKILHPGCYKDRTGEAVFYNGRACSQCTCKCTVEKKKTVRIAMPKAEFSKEYNDIGLVARQVHVSADPEIIQERKCIVEHPFGNIKCSMGMRNLLTKGLRNVGGEFSLAFLAYNFRRALNILGAAKIKKVIAMQ